VIVASEQSNPEKGDDISALAGLASRNPWLAWPMTIGMLGLAGIPGTVGFIGKFQLIHALVDGNYTWLAIVLVIGSMISLGYYLRVIATMWMRPADAATETALAGGPALAPIAGGSPEADLPTSPVRGGSLPPHPPSSPEAGVATAGPSPAVVAVGVVFAAAVVFFGIFASPLFDFAAHAGHALSGLF
jgi:NADH-quinone oxidoreductase subunit N